MGTKVSQMALAGMVFFGSLAQAYIPPVRGLADKIMASRQAAGISEVRLKHRIQLDGGQTLGVEETIVQDRASTWVIWDVPGVKNGVGAQYQNQFYRINNSKAYSSRSGVFLRYLLGDSPDDLLRQLLSEQFLRTEQLNQYNSDFRPEGDPKTWKIREAFLRHPDVSLHRMPGGIAIAVIGLDQSPLKKTVYFDEKAQGMVGTEWREGDMLTYWLYGKFGRSKTPGRFPKEMTFTFNGIKRVDTQLVYVTKLSGGAFAQFRTRYQQADRSGNYSGLVDSALQFLLSYR